MGVAGDAQSSTIEPIHLLKAMLDASENNLSAIIKRIGADPAQLSQNVDAAIAAMPKASGSTMPMAMPSNNLMKVIDNAVKAAERMGDSYATTEHLLIALAQDKGDAGRVLNGLGITGKTVEEAYSSLRGSTRVTDQQSKPELDALNQYGQNLTQKAREGKLDPVIGRSEEIRRTIQVLSRRTKNQPRAYRRAGRRQDGHRRRPGAAHRRRRCPVRLEGPRRHRARPGRHGRRR